MTTPLDIPALKALAGAATPGQWYSLGDAVGTEPYPLGENGQLVCVTDDCNWAYEEQNAAYIAAANPTTVLALIARIEELEKSK